MAMTSSHWIDQPILLPLLACCCGIPLQNRAEYPDPDARVVAVTIHAGERDRMEVPVSVLVEAPDARSVWMRHEDGQYERAGMMAPGIEQAADGGTGRQELWFAIPNLKKGDVLQWTAHLSPHPVEHRRYTWSGEPRQSRRLSCGPCHQGLALPTPAELRYERETLDATGKPPPWPAFPPLPTTKGKDFRWHAGLERFQHSACYECHGRHFVEYQFGQSLPAGTAWAPEPFAGAAEFPNVYYRVFRVKGDQPLLSPPGASTSALPPGLHFGTGSGLRQQHVRILREEANKFAGRQCVLVNWVDESGQVLATEERQLTVKNLRAANGTLAIWMDFVSRIQASSRKADQQEKHRSASWLFAFPSDAGTPVSIRQGEGWEAATFTTGGQRHTAACFIAPGSGAPLRHQENPEQAIGFAVPLPLSANLPQVIHGRLWLQGEDMPEPEIQTLGWDFRNPVHVAVNPPS